MISTNHPSRTRREGRTLEEFPGVVPLLPVDFRPPWMMTPSAPFRIQMWHEANLFEPVWRTEWRFDNVMYPAAESLPPREGVALVVLDEGFRMCFGYSARAEALVEFGTAVWYGCRAAYEWLEQHTDIPHMDLAIWESTAKDRAI